MMSSVEPSLTAVATTQDEPSPLLDERSYRSRSTWPVTRLAGFALTVLLGVSVAGPAMISSLRATQWPALLIPAVLATMSARVTFEALDAGAGTGTGTGTGDRVRSHLIPAIAGALLATAFMAAASVVLGLSWSLGVGGATAGLASADLLAAGGARDLEIRVRLALRRVFFAGSPEARGDLATELARSREATLVGSLGVQGLLGTDAIVEAVRATQATALVLDHEALRNPTIVEAASQLNLEGIHVRELIGYYESEFKKVPLGELTPTWFLFDIASVHEKPVSRSLRRSLEVVISGVALAFGLPFLLVALAIIRATSPGPGLYRQRRAGRHGEPFMLLKLRTMREDDGTSAAWATSEAHRITPVGALLRRYRLDELPQLWNVIRGDLALVGPRPEQVAIAERLAREIPFYSARQSVRPGLTGWAQVNMGYGGSLEGTLAKLQRDLYYVKHGGFRLDCLILWLTLKTVLTGQG